MPARTSSVVLVSSGLDSAVLLAHEATQYDARPVYVRSGLAWEQAELAMLSRLLTSPVYGGLVFIHYALARLAALRNAPIEGVVVAKETERGLLS